ncbi:hypothetical protein T459_24514 [Capsicum annuum]|uniref:Uncharacterized protein n=1 Tax=Capsicum annuum TaxID=4072 RepID=A0A2G2YVI1_CAPAN|nr:hypothetical protein T459_24514 [Capsicum annuum]
MEPDTSSPQPTVDHNASSIILALLDAMSRDLARANVGLAKIGLYEVSISERLDRMESRRNSRAFTPDTLLSMTNPQRPSPNDILADKSPELLEFSKDLSSLEPASKIQLKFLAKEMQYISKGTEKVVHELSRSKNDRTYV